LLTREITLDLVAGFTMKRPRYAVAVVELPGWMDALEFPEWIRDHRILTENGALTSWDKSTWTQLRKLISRGSDSRYSHRCHRAAIYHLKGNLRIPARIESRRLLLEWIESKADFDSKAFMPNLQRSDFHVQAGKHCLDTKAWQRIYPTYPLASAVPAQPATTRRAHPQDHPGGRGPAPALCTQAHHRRRRRPRRSGRRFLACALLPDPARCP